MQIRQLSSTRLHETRVDGESPIIHHAIVPNRFRSAVSSTPQVVRWKTRLLGELTARILGRWSQDWREVFASALGAGLAWLLAQRLLGHAEPVFAAVSAIVCLSPRLPSHLKQTYGLLLGVSTGIIIGELSLALPGDILLRVTLAPFVAMLIASAYGQAAVVPIQAGVSAILVVALGPATTGSARMADVAIGAAVGLLFSQILPASEQSQNAKAD